jgi:hypothetical protein
MKMCYSENRIFEIGSEELIQLFEDKAEHHEQRYLFYKEQYDALPDSMKTLPKDQEMFTSGNNMNPVGRIKDRMKFHEQQNHKFVFLSTHLGEKRKGSHVIEFSLNELNKLDLI